MQLNLLSELEMVSEGFLSNGCTVIYVIKMKQVSVDSQGPGNPEPFPLPEQAGLGSALKPGKSLRSKDAV